MIYPQTLRTPSIINRRLSDSCLNVEGVDDADGRRQDPGSPGGEVVHRVNSEGR